MKFGDKFYDRLEVRVERAYSQYTFILDFDSRISDRFDHRTRSLDRNIFKNTIPLQILSLSRREGRWFGDLYSHSFESVEKDGGGEGRGNPNTRETVSSLRCENTNIFPVRPRFS